VFIDDNKEGLLSLPLEAFKTSNELAEKMRILIKIIINRDKNRETMVILKGFI